MRATGADSGRHRHRARRRYGLRIAGIVAAAAGLIFAGSSLAASQAADSNVPGPTQTGDAVGTTSAGGHADRDHFRWHHRAGGPAGADQTGRCGARGHRRAAAVDHIYLDHRGQVGSMPLAVVIDKTGLGG